MKFYLCGFVLLAPESILQWSPAKQNPGFLLSWPHTCDVTLEEIQRSREEKSWFIPILFCVKNECCSNPASSVMPHKSGQFWWNYKTTRRNFGDSQNLWQSSPSQMLPSCRILSWTEYRRQISFRTWAHPRQTANVASLSSALTIPTFALPVVCPGDRGENWRGYLVNDFTQQIHRQTLAGYIGVRAVTGPVTPGTSIERKCKIVCCIKRKIIKVDPRRRRLSAPV